MQSYPAEPQGSNGFIFPVTTSIPTQIAITQQPIPAINSDAPPVTSVPSGSITLSLSRNCAAASSSNAGTSTSAVNVLPYPIAGVAQPNVALPYPNLPAIQPTAVAHLPAIPTAPFPEDGLKS